MGTASNEPPGGRTTTAKQSPPPSEGGGAAGEARPGCEESQEAGRPGATTGEAGGGGREGDAVERGLRLGLISAEE
eukprot:6636047-Pyramimonas_sp.AAC.2